MLLSSIVRALILPATPLLVPGLTPGLRADPLAAVRQAVATALAALVDDGRVPLVLAHGPALRWGRLRPSLAGSGIGDRWLPDAGGRPGRTATSRPRAPAPRWRSWRSRTCSAQRAADVETLEVPPDGAGPDGRSVDLLRRADCLVVAGGGAPGGLDTGPDALTDGIRAALRVAGADAWGAEVQAFEQSHDHLPAEYRVTILS